DRRRPDEGPAAPLQVLGQRRRLGGQATRPQRRRRDAPRPRRRCWFEAPRIGRERTELGAQLAQAARVVDRRFDLAAMADDPRVAEQPLDVAGAEAGDSRGVEAGERAPEGVALVEDRDPAEPGLEAFEAELLEQTRFVVDREAPFTVVVFAVGRARLAPGAAAQTGLVGEEPVARAHARSGKAPEWP